MDDKSEQSSWHWIYLSHLFIEYILVTFFLMKPWYIYILWQNKKIPYPWAISMTFYLRLDVSFLWYINTALLSHYYQWHIKMYKKKQINHVTSCTLSPGYIMWTVKWKSLVMPKSWSKGRNPIYSLNLNIFCWFVEFNWLHEGKKMTNG